MSDDAEPTFAVVHQCGGACPAGGEHQWDGPEVSWDTGSSASCSKCGIAATDHALLSEP